jgi:hypothetical protein
VVEALRFGIVQLPGDDTFTAELESIGVRLDALAPVYDAIYAIFRRIEQDRFDREGPGWKPLAPSTAANRVRLGVGAYHPILNLQVPSRGRKASQLRKSLTTAGATNAVVEPIPDGLFMGTNDPLAIVHHRGTSDAGRSHNVRIPARPLVDMREQDAALFGDVIGDYVFGLGLAVSSSSGSFDHAVAGI